MKKWINLSILLLLYKIYIELFEVSELPTIVSMTHIQAMVIIDVVLKLILHPGFFYIINAGCLMYVLIRIGKETDEYEKMKYTKDLSSLAVLLIGFVLFPYVSELVHNLT